MDKRDGHHGRQGDDREDQIRGSRVNRMEQQHLPASPGEPDQRPQQDGLRITLHAPPHTAHRIERRWNHGQRPDDVHQGVGEPMPGRKLGKRSPYPPEAGGYQRIDEPGLLHVNVRTGTTRRPRSCGRRRCSLLPRHSRLADLLAVRPRQQRVAVEVGSCDGVRQVLALYIDIEARKHCVMRACGQPRERIGDSRPPRDFRAR